MTKSCTSPWIASLPDPVPHNPYLTSTTLVSQSAAKALSSIVDNSLTRSDPILTILKTSEAVKGVPAAESTHSSREALSVIDMVPLAISDS